MRPPLRHLVTLLLPFGVGLCLAPAQIHSPQVNLPHHEKPEDLSWLTTYTQPAPAGREAALIRDPRFVALLRHHLSAPQTFWGNTTTPAAEAALDYLSGPPGSVTLSGNRYLLATGCVARFCANRGLLWVDLGLPHPLFVFAAIDWISDNRSTDQPDSSYTLWLFPSRPIASTQFPTALREALVSWTTQPPAATGILQNVTRVFLIQPDGTPQPLAPSTAGAHNTLPAETTDTTKVPS